MSVGRYFRWNLHQEKKRYQAALAQRSDEGKPAKLVDADFTDWARIIEKRHRRFAQVFSDGIVGEDSWKLTEAENNADNFKILGGDGTDEGAKAALVGGNRAILYTDVDYKCGTAGAGGLDTAMAEQIHHKFTSVSAGELTDEHTKWTNNALIGWYVDFGQGDTFEIMGNTATTLTLGGAFDPDVHDTGDGYYWVVFGSDAAGTYDVFLDVHLEDWGITEDSDLNHNPSGTELEGMRRLKLIQRVWVEKQGAAWMLSKDVNSYLRTYVDFAGDRHYVLKLGEITRDGGLPIEEAEINNVRNEFGGSPPEVIDARDFGLASCLSDDPTTDQAQPQSLVDRLDRGDTYVTVGDGTNSFGMYNGTETDSAAGLVAALACSSTKAVFLKAGTYDLSEGSHGKLSIPAGVAVFTEAITDLGVTVGIKPDPDAATASIELGAGSVLDGARVLRTTANNSVPCILMKGARGLLNRCRIQDSAAGGDATVLVLASYGSRVAQSEISRTNGAALRVAENQAVPPAALGYINYSNDEDPAAGSASHGIEIIDSLIYGTNTNKSIDEPMVYLAASAGCTMSRCSVVADTILLRTSGRHVNHEAPGTPEGRNAFIISDNVFISLADAGLSSVSAVRLGSAVNAFHNNTLEINGTISVTTDMPGTALYVVPDSLYPGSSSIRANFIRCGVWGIVAASGLEHVEVDVTGNVLVPANSAGSMTKAVLFNLSSRKSGWTMLNGNFVRMNEGTYSGIDTQGACEVLGNHIDASFTNTVDVGGDGLPDGSAGRGLVLHDLAPEPAVGEGGYVAEISARGNTVIGAGGVGIEVASTAGSSRAACVLDSNNIDLRGRGLIGILVDEDKTAPLVVRGNSVRNTKREGFRDENTTGDHTVENNHIERSGLEDSLGGDSEGAVGVRGGHRIVSNTLMNCKGRGVLLEAGNNKDVSDNYIYGCGGGVAYIAASNGENIHICTNTIVDPSVVEGVRVYKADSVVVRDNKIRGSWAQEAIDVLSATNVEIVDNSIRGSSGGSGTSVACMAVDRLLLARNTINDDNNVEAAAVSVGLGSNRVQFISNVVESLQTRGVIILSDGALPGMVIRGNTIRAGKMPVPNNAPDPGFTPQNRSLYAFYPKLGAPAVIEDNDLEFGAALDMGSGSTNLAWVKGNTCRQLGIYVRSRGGGRVCNNEICCTAPASDGGGVAHCAIDCTGIWVGGDYRGTNQYDAVETWMTQARATEITNNVVNNWTTLNYDLTTNMGAENGRSAGIVAQVGRLSVIAGNRVVSTAENRLGILVGWIDSVYRSDAGGGHHRRGVPGNISIRGNFVRAGQLVVLVLWDGRYPVYISGNHFVDVTPAGLTVIKVYEQAASAEYVVVRGNEAYLPPGTLSDYGHLELTETVDLHPTPADLTTHNTLFHHAANDVIGEPTP